MSLQDSRNKFIDDTECSTPIVIAPQKSASTASNLIDAMSHDATVLRQKEAQSKKLLVGLCRRHSLGLQGRIRM
jgi:hypothetical protein